MKKLIALSAFIVIGFTAAYAQGPAKAATKQTSVTTATPVAAQAPSTVSSVKSMEATSETITPAAEAKKECSAEEKKACGKASGKKSCCSKASSEAKPANQ